MHIDAFCIWGFSITICMHASSGEEKAMLQPESVGACPKGDKMADPLAAVTDFNPMDMCAGFFAEAWTHSNQKLVISISGFHKAVQACRNILDLSL